MVWIYAMSSLDLIISSTVSITSCTSLLSLSDYLLQFFQTNDAQLSTMVAEQVLVCQTY